MYVEIYKPDKYMRYPLLSTLSWALRYVGVPLLLVTPVARAHLDASVPILKFLDGGLTRAQFTQTIKAFEAVFAPYAHRDQRTFEILSDWDTAWPQAFARRWETDHLVVYGGIARIPGSTVDSFALTLCHEVGHLYGGEPFGDEHNRLAVEGQADYWATSECWEKIISELPLRDGSVQDRGVAAAIVLTAFFAANRSLPAPRIETPDPSIAERINRTHPLPQCRLDTYLAGLELKERPLCWWAP